MLSGIYEHNIDGKNRVFIPAKFREIMGDEYTYKLCPSKYPSIQLFSKEHYNKLYPETEFDTANPIKDRNLRAGRNLGKGDATCDGQGRIVKVEQKLPMEGTGKGKAAVVPVTLELKGTMDGTYEFIYA